MKSLFSLLNEKKTSSPIMRGAVSALTVESANEILDQLFGVEARQYARAIYVKDSVLGVKISANIAAGEIRLHESQILSKIREKYGENAVKQIRFQL